VPLLDHFHQPLRRRLAWEALHSGWATRIADDLNARWLPPEYVAAECTQLHGRLEVDVVTYENPESAAGGDGAVTATRTRTWTPPPTTHTAPAVFPDTVEVRVIRTTDGDKVVAVIELVGPSNKDRPAERRAFAAKCAGYLASGASVVVVDIVTEKQFNLHNELARLLEMGRPAELPGDPHLYAVSYRPVMRGGRPEIDIWPVPLALGEPLPTLPLRLIEDEFVPVELEATYTEACRRRRLI
jgi:hypothetical protein